MGFRHVYDHDPLPLSPSLSIPLHFTTCPATPRAPRTATHPSRSALLTVGPPIRSPFVVIPPHGRSLHPVTLRGRPFSRSVPPLRYPSCSALLMVGASTLSPFAVGPPQGRALHSITLRGRPSLGLVPPYGHPSRLALLTVSSSTRSPFAVGPPQGLSLRSATHRRRPTSRSVFTPPVSHNHRFLHYSLR